MSANGLPQGLFFLAEQVVDVFKDSAGSLLLAHVNEQACAQSLQEQRRLKGHPAFVEPLLRCMPAPCRRLSYYQDHQPESNVDVTCTPSGLHDIMTLSACCAPSYYFEPFHMVHVTSS